MSFGAPQQPLVPKRAAPPPPPSITSPPQNWGSAPPAGAAPPPIPTRPSGPPPNFASQPAQPQYTPQATAAPAKKGMWSSFSKNVSGLLGKESSQQNRNELLGGTTPPTKPAMPAANDQHWNTIQNDKQAQEQYYQNLANQIDTKQFESTLRTAQNTEQLGMATLDALGAQAEEIDNLERNVETIHLQLDRGDRQLRSIGGMTGAVSNLVTKDKAAKQNRRVYNAFHNEQDREIHLDTSHAARYAVPQYVAPTSNTSQSVAGQSIKDKLAEQDRQLSQLSSSLGNMQNIAGTMNTELHRQNRQLDDLTFRTDQAIHRTHESTYKMQRLQ